MKPHSKYIIISENFLNLEHCLFDNLVKNNLILFSNIVRVHYEFNMCVKGKWYPFLKLMQIVITQKLLYIGNHAYLIWC